MPIEIEIGFKLPSELIKERLIADEAIAESQFRAFENIDMIAEYYDTPTHALKERSSTLRRRVENGASYVTFKRNSHYSQQILLRDTWECAGDEVSAAIVTLEDMGAPADLSELARREGFVTRGRFEFTRHSAPLFLGGGNTSVEMNIDEGVILAGDKESELNEVLFKFLYGNQTDFESFMLVLEDKYGLTRELSSKYERVLRLIRSR